MKKHEISAKPSGRLYETNYEFINGKWIATVEETACNSFFRVEQGEFTADITPLQLNVKKIIDAHDIKCAMRCEG